MTKVLPMLSGEGWQKDPELIMARLFVHMFLTDHSQSNIYQGHVTSLQYIISEHGDDVPSLKSAVTSAVQTYYQRFFSNVTVQFDLSKSDDEDKSSKMAFDIFITGTYDGVVYTLSRAMRVDNSTGVKRFLQAFDN